MNTVVGLREGEETKRILAEAIEHGEGETTAANKAAGGPAVSPAEVKQPASPSPSSKAKRVAVEEEEIALASTETDEEETDEEAPKRAAAVEADAIDPPKPAKAKATKAKAKAADESNFEDMLNSILG
jgi:hypothetical protein